MTGLLDWLTDPPVDRGIRFLSADGGWEFWSYRRLAELSRRAARGLVRAGVRPGDLVALAERTGPDFVGAFFGVLIAGGTVAPIAPPVRFQDAEAYAGQLAGVLAAIRPALLVCHPDALPALAGAGPRVLVTPSLLEPAGGPDQPRPPAALAVVQLTSGTTGQVRGVRVPFRTLEATVEAIRTWLGMSAADPTASWLPLHHDMGLVGCLLTPVTTGSDLWLMSTEQFVRWPQRYLECFGRSGARLTAMPAFGLDHIRRRVPPEALAGWDFSAWRAVIVGAERIPARVLEGFAALCGPAGLDPGALLPAYGLAEATLAVTGLPIGEGWRTAGTDPPVVGCGYPLAGVGVEIHDEDGRPAPAGTPGQIVVTGRTVADGYAGDEREGATAVRDGVLRTGDSGFLLDGQLFVLGRRGDSVKVHGRALYADDLDALLTAELGVPARRVATVLGHDGATCTAVVVFEGGRPEWLAAAPRLLRGHLAGGAVLAFDVPAGTVPRTTSGKPRRAELWRGYLSGALRSP